MKNFNLPAIVNIMRMTGMNLIYAFNSSVHNNPQYISDEMIKHCSMLSHTKLSREGVINSDLNLSEHCRDCKDDCYNCIKLKFYA